jgi:D-alanine-D-alanine ligase
VEEYIEGRELTVGLLGERRPRVLPPMEVVFVNPTDHPVYGFEEKQESNTKVRFECPATLTAVELKRVEKICRDTFATLGCRDVARIDLRLAKDGTVYVIECNPLPGLTPDFSDLCVIAKVVGMDHRTLIGEILDGCIKRHREARAQATALPAHAGTARSTAISPGEPNGPAASPPSPPLPAPAAIQPATAMFATAQPKTPNGT